MILILPKNFIWIKSKRYKLNSTHRVIFIYEEGFLCQSYTSWKNNLPSTLPDAQVVYPPSSNIPPLIPSPKGKTEKGKSLWDSESFSTFSSIQKLSEFHVKQGLFWNPICRESYQSFNPASIPFSLLNYDLEGILKRWRQLLK